MTWITCRLCTKLQQKEDYINVPFIFLCVYLWNLLLAKVKNIVEYLPNPELSQVFWNTKSAIIYRLLIVHFSWVKKGAVLSISAGIINWKWFNSLLSSIPWTISIKPKICTSHWDCQLPFFLKNLYIHYCINFPVFI